MSEINNKQPMSPTLFNEFTSKPLYDLQEVIQQYQSNPELLKLILTSKVEEDKRRTEEAKLRVKELDLYYQHNNHKILPSINKTPTLRTAPYTIPSKPHNRYHHSSISSISSLSSSSLSEEEEEEMPDIKTEEEEEDVLEHQQRRHSAAAAMLAMGGSFIEADKEKSEIGAYPSPETDQYEEDNNKPRRRREMQAITKIVETREFPYIDNYFWKNNGNTIQKKTGCKSIYYKCSNSNKGCTVNKTVTAKPNGEYLIKYRGSHLPECGKVERIRDL